MEKVKKHIDIGKMNDYGIKIFIDLTKKIYTHTSCFRSQKRKVYVLEVLKWNAVSKWKTQM